MKQKFNNLLIVSFLTIFSSCISSHKMTTYKEVVESYDKYNTYKTIHLDTVCKKNGKYIEFENKDALILFDTKDFLNYVSEKLNDTSLCLPKKQYLENLVDTVNHCTTNLYFIESMMTPERLKQLSYPNLKQYEKAFIYPYGYESKLDTNDKKRLYTLKQWVISDLCINGKCLVFDKRVNSFVDKIFYLITDFKDGHGGENLIFEDKKYFFIVDVYSCIKYPDFDCMSNDEIEEWNENIKKRREK